MSQPFATASDVSVRMARPLTGDDLKRAGVLCEDASDMLRERWPDLDDRMAAGDLRTSSVKRVVAAMVRRAVQNTASEGVASLGQAAGPFSMNATYSNPDGALFVSKAEAAVLGGDQAQAGQAFTVDLWSPQTGWSW